MRWAKAIGVVGMVAGLGACASIVGSTESAVQLRTNPENATCELTGRNGFSRTVRTPASVTLPNAAAPLTVTCTAPGYRPTANTLDASASGWIWGNSAFMMATGGIALLGALVDESRGAGRAYKTDASFTLDADRPRAITTTERNGGRQMELKAR